MELLFTKLGAAAADPSQPHIRVEELLAAAQLRPQHNGAVGTSGGGSGSGAIAPPGPEVVKIHTQ